MKRRRRRKSHLWRGLSMAMALILILAAGMCLRRWCVSAVRIAGTSMNDTLSDGDVVLVTRFDFLLGGKPQRGDIVECVFPDREDTYIKRVVGLPGERLVFSNGLLTVDGRPVSEPYVSSFTEDFSVELGMDEYFVLGDNRMESYDSRAADMGAIDAEAFLGRVRLVVWPLSHFGVAV